MTEQDKRLARAWLALVPWRVGMVDARGEVITGREINIDPMRIPDLNSPANWGHWLAWASEHAEGEGGAALHNYGRGEVCARVWDVSGTRHQVRGSSPASVLLAAYVLATAKSALPPAVLDWWKHEQEG